MGKHSNISIFVPHIGCPNICSFCNQRTISGCTEAPTPEDVRRICALAAEQVKSPEDTEIAFFGGSFTAIDKSYSSELLSAARNYVAGFGEKGIFKGIRLSTRPDCIDGSTLDRLKKNGVTAIELGAQSMSDKVLAANNRGHTADDVVKASEMIREQGFELGLQMMVGLYQSTAGDELYTMRKIIGISPDTVRIYPTVVLAGTHLAELYMKGEYVLAPFDEIVELCAGMLGEFETAGIRVIKCGLHASDGVDGERVAGYYHPAFRELCEGRLMRRQMEKALAGLCKGEVEFAVNPSCISRAMGHKKENIRYFLQKEIAVKVRGDLSVPKLKCKLINSLGAER